MFKSNAKFALRNIYKNFFFSAINISGLAFGIMSVLFIFFYIQNEVSYDSFHEKKDRIFRIVVGANFKGNDFKLAEAGGIVGPTIKKDFPEVESFTRINDWGIYFIRYEDVVFKEKNIISADSTFFNVFSIPVIQGNPNTILSPPHSVAISRSAAKRYFGNDDPIGKVLNFDERETYTVNGVFEDIPSNSHFSADFIVTHTHRKNIDENGWTSANYYTYLLLNKNIDAEKFKAKLNPVLVEYINEALVNFGLDLNDLKLAGTFWNFKVQKLTDIHFDTIYQHSLNPSTDQSYIIIFSAIGIFILLIASINFINLSTAKSASRAKEVGIKKVVGSFKSDLIIQFLTESIIISLISLVLAIGLVELFKPYFFDLLGREFEISYLANISFGFMILGLVVFIGIIAGSFPAFVLSGFAPVAVLKGNLQNVMKKSWFRSSLVVFQFTASITLIIGTIIIFNQLEFMQNKNLGFNKEQVLIIDDTYILKDQVKVFKDEMLKHPGVVNATVSGYLPIKSYRGINGSFRDGDINDPNVMPMQWWRIDTDYFNTLGMKLISGRNFSPDMATDSQAVIINRACLEYCGWDNPFDHTIGQIVSQDGRIEEYPIIGVVENFHFKSLKSSIEPVIFRLRRHTGYISFRVNENFEAVINKAEILWKEMVPSQPFSYQFMDEAFNKEYKGEVRILNLFRAFSFIAVLVGCLGLFGLSAYTAEKRTKEIGIRKVHGATVGNLIYLLSKEFTLLVITAIIIASPIAYFLMEGWLQDYAYRISIGAGTFLFSGFLALVIALITVSFHAVRASVVNPISSLRSE